MTFRPCHFTFTIGHGTRLARVMGQRPGDSELLLLRESAQAAVLQLLRLFWNCQTPECWEDQLNLCLQLVLRTLMRTHQVSSSSQPWAVASTNQKTFLFMGKDNHNFVLFGHFVFKCTHNPTVGGPDPTANLAKPLTLGCQV